MLEINRKKVDKLKYLLLSGLLIVIMLIIAISYKSNDKITKKTSEINNYKNSSDLLTFKKFLLKQIKSPYNNLNYEVKNGDTIQKILKKFKVNNNEIQLVINHYKKYGNPAQLLVGKKIDITIKNDPKTKNNSIIKFASPITKSTKISIERNDENKIVSKKIISATNNGKKYNHSPLIK